MNGKNVFFLCVVLLFNFAVFSEGVVDMAGRYSIYLPDNWIVEAAGDTQDFFYDTTAAYPSLISLVRHSYDKNLYPTAEEWTRAHFIAYLLVVNVSRAPWGEVLYFDSSRTSTQGSLWAPEAYCRFFSLDTALDSWAEFSRFTATDAYGYELYAIGDTLDMKENIGCYAAILLSIRLPESAGIAYPVLRPADAGGNRCAGETDRLFSALGRRYDRAARCLPPGLFVVTGTSGISFFSRERLKRLP